MFIDGDQGGNHPDANTANKEEKIYPKGAALDLLFGQRGVVVGRRGGIHIPKANRAILIRPMRILVAAWSRIPMTMPSRNMPSSVIFGSRRSSAAQPRRR